MRQLAKARRWETEMNSKVSEMRAVTIGCVWWMNNCLASDASPDVVTIPANTPEQEEMEKYSVSTEYY